LLKIWYKVALYASLAQLALGPLNLFTLPWHAVEWGMVIMILVGLTFALIAMYMMWQELKGPDEHLGKHFYAIAAILTITVLFMGTARHMYRATALEPHQEAVKEVHQK
jgi:cytochrome c